MKITTKEVTFIVKFTEPQDIESTDNNLRVVYMTLDNIKEEQCECEARNCDKCNPNMTEHDKLLLKG
jgi:hypothetical protein